MDDFYNSIMIDVTPKKRRPTNEEAEVPKPEGDPVMANNKGMFREVGDCTEITVSTQKSTFGPSKLRDNSTDTYWQSDGQLPHLISIQFAKKTVLTDVCLYFNYRKDESYTPSLLAIKSGTNFSDLRVIDSVSLHEPNGWVIIPVKSRDRKNLLKTFLLQIVILSNHLNGRDSHVRQIKIHSPSELSNNGLVPVHGVSSNFSTMEFLQYSTIR